jgi:thiol-disulfide isomerase/thioredoxin
MTTEAPTPGNSGENSAPKSSSPGLAKALLPVGLILLAVVGALFVIRSRQPRPAPVPQAADSGAPVVADMRVGATLPDFQLHPFKDSSSEVAASSLRGKVSLINFWATWCEACMVEMPSIVKLYQGYKDRGFDVVAVDLDTNPEVVLPRTIRRYGMSFSVYTDTDSKLADLFQVQAIPLSVVMDRNRKILLIENEGLDWNGNEFRAALEKWLAG